MPARATNKFEIYKEVRYKVPRISTFTLLDATAVAQRFGWKEIIDFRIDWVKAERIREILEEKFPQTDPEGFYFESPPSVTRKMEGHNLFDIAGRASRFVSIGAGSVDVASARLLFTKSFA